MVTKFTVIIISIMYVSQIIISYTCLKKKFFLGPHPWHAEVPRLGAEAELQLLAYTTATAMWNLTLIVTYTSVHCNATSLTH